MQKGFENLGDAAQGALKAGIAGTKSVLAKRKAEKKAREIEAKQNQRERKSKVNQEDHRNHKLLHTSIIS